MATDLWVLSCLVLVIAGTAHRIEVHVQQSLLNVQNEHVLERKIKRDRNVQIDRLR